MTTAVIGATGRVGSEIVRGVLERGEAITALVRDPAKPAAPSANPAGRTSVPRASTTSPSRSTRPT
jgi:putative NADH-flavin reductase